MQVNAKRMLLALLKAMANPNVTLLPTLVVSSSLKLN